MSAGNPTYALITPARNEEAFIEQTIQAVVNQTIRPTRWVIVSDGSTDGTDEIVSKHLSAHSWIRLVRLPTHSDRQFAAKVQAFNAGFATLERDAFDIVGNLDADITFEKDYFAYLLSKFTADERLGVAGTPFVEDGRTYDFRFTSIEHVSGACQMFRRQCFQDIGGYLPLEGGGIDWVAVTTARMKGWKTQTFDDRVCCHHRPMGTASTGKLKALLSQGKQDYYLGGRPLWQLFRAVYQMTRTPYVVGGALLLFGYARAAVAREPRPISRELVQFHRKEQLSRLRNFFASRQEAREPRTKFFAE